MKRIYLIITVLLSLFLAGCGGDGEGLFDTGDQQEKVAKNQKITIVDCNSSNYIDINTNDLLVKDTDNTSVKIVHNSDNSKKICVLSGSAHIVRDN